MELMCEEFGKFDMCGCIVIGEGECDDVLMFFIGEQFGICIGQEGVMQVDIVVDLLEGMNFCVIGVFDVMVVFVVVECGGLFYVLDVYMEKFVVGLMVVECIYIDVFVVENFCNIVEVFDCCVSELMIIVFECECYEQFIEDICFVGVCICFIGDGDLFVVIVVVVCGIGVYVVMGIGGVLEGVFVVVVMCCFGGCIQGWFVVIGDDQVECLQKFGYDNIDCIYEIEDFVLGEQIFFSCLGVIDGELFEGVCFFGGGMWMYMFFMLFLCWMICFVDMICCEDINLVV